MADNSGFPYCTKWKNYRYPLTRLTRGTHYAIESTSGYFAHPSRTRELDIWISDDWCFHGDALGIEYNVVMVNDATGGGNDGIKTIQYPRIFHDNVAGTKTLTPGAPHLGWLGTSDNHNYIDVGSSAAATISSNGNAQSLYTVIPGLHFGFMGTTSTGYADDANCAWTMKKEALDGLPKIVDGTYTCWYRSPVTAGDTVATDILPAGIGNRSINISLNLKRHMVKKSSSDINWGATLYLEGSIDKVNWASISKLIDDGDDLGPQQVHWDSNALDGNDFPYKRIKISFDATAEDEMTIHPNQWLEMAITPN